MNDPNGGYYDELGEAMGQVSSLESEVDGLTTRLSALEAENAELRELLLDAIEADDLAALNASGSLDEEWKERQRERFGPKVRARSASAGGEGES